MPQYHCIFPSDFDESWHEAPISTKYLSTPLHNRTCTFLCHVHLSATYHRALGLIHTAPRRWASGRTFGIISYQGTVVIVLAFRRNMWYANQEISMAMTYLDISTIFAKKPMDIR